MYLEFHFTVTVNILPDSTVTISIKNSEKLNENLELVFAPKSATYCYGDTKVVGAKQRLW
jgi:hypothetical protein